jgi:hypothetical protein
VCKGSLGPSSWPFSFNVLAYLLWKTGGKDNYRASDRRAGDRNATKKSRIGRGILFTQSVS